MQTHNGDIALMTAGNIRVVSDMKLPEMAQDNRELRDWMVRVEAGIAANRAYTDKRFDEILDKLERDREAQNQWWEERWGAQQSEWEKKWNENNHRWEENDKRWDENDRRWEENDRRWDENDKRWDENDRRWDENDKRWDENDRRWDENDKRWDENDRRWDQNDKRWNENDRRWDENDKKLGRIERSIGAIGARWGMKSEAAFRNGLVGILEQNFDVQVLNVNECDEEGEVFGYPEQIELDIIIKNGLLLICELKSSVSGSDVYIFQRKAKFYEKRHQRQANRLIVISPMILPQAQKVAERFGIDTYTDSLDVETL
uniref:PD-(D/E)XK nuclease superfamily protein n=1 Tax=Candidatus Kentrum sp. MB TaxID=2138164 RepID=A0A450X3G6_9GAMM|nr:MAG: Protein of unknown function (DUF3782) [Candidatus Kentron sp. MB]VFK26670.1 MAG: Protein of unknown function (DUF3782) [Candidatus Kentron sp. MB]VFK74592.1 MAG: Protein of unknown function (DUF3782) [Candidatus Kentron sp. MB]